MIAAKYTQGGQLAIAETAMPRTDAGELLLKVEAASICGTDIKIARHGHRKLADGQTITLGHEFVGRIAEVGADVKGWRPGQRVGVAPNRVAGGAKCAAGGWRTCARIIPRSGSTSTAGACRICVRVPRGPRAGQRDGDRRVVGRRGGHAGRAAVVRGQRLAGLAGGTGRRGRHLRGRSDGPAEHDVREHLGASVVGVVDVNPARLKKAKELGAGWTVDSSKQSAADAINVKTNGRAPM